MKAELEKMGYVVGAKVRQYHNVTQYDDAVILCVHDNGALDVEIDDKKFGWVADRCVPMGVLDNEGYLTGTGSGRTPRGVITPKK